jgi:hypothetical protein
MEKRVEECAMSDRDRISINIKDIREPVESFRSDAAWREFSLAGKIRSMVADCIELTASQTTNNSNTSGRAELFIKSLVKRGSIDVLDLQRLADELAIPSLELAKVLKDCCLGKDADSVTEKGKSSVKK